MVKICFICTGNTCRSIIAERLMKKSLKDRKIDNVKVSSKGLNATGENITVQAKLVLKKNHALSSNRKSIILKKVDNDTLYIVMTESMKKYIDSNKVLTMKDLIGHDILDPYGLGEPEYEQTASQIKIAVERLIEKIKMWREV